MIKEQAEMLQEEFVELSKEHGIKASFGYFIDKVDRAMLAYNGITDNEMMYMISQLVVRIAVKNETCPDEVLRVLGEGIKKQFPEEEEPAPQN